MLSEQTAKHQKSGHSAYHIRKPQPNRIIHRTERIEQIGRPQRQAGGPRVATPYF